MTSQIAQQVASNPPFVSYAQNYEDVMLRRALRQVERGFYIDVGAQSPDSDSVTKAFSLHGWRGINIEPHPTYSAQLLQLRPHDINLDVALGEKSGSLKMNFVDDSGLSTADEGIANQHAAAGYAVRVQEVKMLTLAEVWRSYVPDAQPVHFLKVDVEGLERAVLAGNDWKTNRPWIVLVEATLPNSQIENHLDWEPILLVAGYEFVYADGLNRFYVAREHVDLGAAFKYPPNVFDAFITASSDAAYRELVVLRQEIPRLHSEHGRVTGEFEQALNEHQRRISLVERQLLLAIGRESALQARLDRSDYMWRQTLQRAEAAELQRDDIERLRYEAERRYEQATAQRDETRRQHDEAARRCSEAEKQHDEAERQHTSAMLQRDEARRQRDEATLQRDVVLQSPWWRLSEPGRVLVSWLPKSLRRQVRRSAKAAWWMLTPWLMPARLRYMRARGRDATFRAPDSGPHS